MIKVSKFGGTSLAGSDQYKAVKAIIERDSLRQVIVVSAPGRNGDQGPKITDLLFLLDAHLKYKVPYDNLLTQIKSRYESIALTLSLAIDTNAMFTEFEEALKNKPSQGYIVSRGEYWNALLLASYLGYQFVDAAKVIRFDYSGNIQMEWTKQALKDAYQQYGTIVVPGFYGSYPDQKIHIMSRGGSDVTGTYCAIALDAAVYENFTDVNGIRAADPAIVDHPVQIKTLSYNELRELAYMGANVIHEDAVLPLSYTKIPLEIKSTFSPDEPGTRISNGPFEDDTTVTGIAGKKEFTSISIALQSGVRKIDALQTILSVFSQFGVNIEHIPSGIDSFSFVFEAQSIQSKFHQIHAKLEELPFVQRIDVDENIALIAVVGRNMANKPGIAGTLFSILGDARVNIKLIAQSSQELSIILGVDHADFAKAIRLIYRKFFPAES